MPHLDAAAEKVQVGLHEGDADPFRSSKKGDVVSGAMSDKEGRTLPTRSGAGAADAHSGSV